MRVLILSCNTGEGHNACARALQESFHAKGIACDREDAFRFISRGLSQVVSDGFTSIYRHSPLIFDVGYKFSEKHPDLFDADSGVYKMLTVGCDRLFRFLYSGGYDTVVCTHVFAALMVTDIRHRYPIALHTSFFPTDYTCYPGSAQCDLDTLFIPAADLAPDYIAAGVPEKTLLATGIPVRPAFYEKLDKAEARRRLGLPEHCRHLMVMCGSMGCGPLRKIAKLMQKQLPENCIVTILCGTNKHLYETMRQSFADDARFRILPFVKDIPTLMDASDLYLTKPGGLSVTEAAHKRLPMAFIHAVEGCESYNRAFFTQRGCAISPETLPELASETVALLMDDDRLAAMAKAQARHFPGNSTEQVVSALIDADRPAPRGPARPACPPSPTRKPKEASAHEITCALC